MFGYIIIVNSIANQHVGGYMIVCSCNVITECKIKACIESNDAATVGQIFKQLECKPECATCVRTIINLMNQHKATVSEF